MTILDAIHQIDTLKPNTYSQEQKIRWLSTLDGVVKKEIIDTHEGGEGISFEPYTLATAGNDLLIPAPYDDVYLRWLEVQIDYANNEYAKYQNSMTMYNAAYVAFERYYNRTHMPLGTKLKFF